ncbi:MAG TPA: dTDP-4-dehydrorhamnose 3,5-epimerase [Ramlibacter sp.]|nr:dTDP-4-dehydrorhamnose 3,5-epimerase [Ramlibacter sp.]
MIFTQTRLKGVYIIEMELREDERGFFARSWCESEFRAHQLNPSVAQCNVSFNGKKGTLRGMHYAAPPFEEAKLVRCTAGSLYDVVIDLRPDSPTYKQHLGEVLSASNHKMLYVPEGFAHGFQTLQDNTEVFYQMSRPYEPGYARGVRYDDPAFGIEWKMAEPVMLERDRNYPDFAG